VTFYGWGIVGDPGGDVMRRDPEALGLHPDGDPAPPARRQGARGDWPLGRALRSGVFWMLGGVHCHVGAGVMLSGSMAAWGPRRPRSRP
jgi:hypothetical protein